MDTEHPPALRTGIVPPDRVEVGDLVMRRWQVGDMAAEFAAISASFEQLHHWMAWAAQPPDFEEMAATHARSSAWPTPDGGFNYGVFDRAGTVLGVVGLHDRVGPATLEIGYWCHSEHVGRGVITRTAGALTTVALSLPGIDRVEIHCDAANLRSAAVARRLGYRLESTGPRAVCTPGESGRGMHWVMDRATRSARGVAQADQARPSHSFTSLAPSVLHMACTIL